MIRWTGLAPWEFGFPFPGSLRSTFPVVRLPNGRLGGLGLQNGAIEPHALMLSTPERTEGGMEGEKTPNLSLRQAQIGIPIRDTKRKVD